jgi:hypothetical protein
MDICSAQISTPISKIRSNVLKILRSNVHFFAALLSTQSAQMSSAVIINGNIAVTEVKCWVAESVLRSVFSLHDL